jgi:hypothetical protein
MFFLRSFVGTGKYTWVRRTVTIVDFDPSDRVSDRVGDREGFRQTLVMMVGGIPPASHTHTEQPASAPWIGDRPDPAKPIILAQ